MGCFRFCITLISITECMRLQTQNRYLKKNTYHPKVHEVKFIQLFKKERNQVNRVKMIPVPS